MLNNSKLTVGSLFTGTLAVGGFLYWQNYGLMSTTYTYSSKNLPQSFKGFKITQISDYHNEKKLHNKILRMTEKEKPDMIAVTGDLFDRRKTDIERGLSLISGLVEIAPVYYVTGNHEAKIEKIEDIKKIISHLGAFVLENKKVKIYKNGESITLMGVADPWFFTKNQVINAGRTNFRENLLEFSKGTEGFRLLLSHRPDFIHTYHDAGMDLVLTGHAHGGQFRIPFTNQGVYVPDQGILPKYATGVKKLGGTTVVISRGIGNSSFPQRLFNRPEIVNIMFE